MNFLRQLLGELKKMFARKRTYIGFAAFVFLEGLVLLLIELHGGKEIKKLIQLEGGGVEYFFSATTIGFIVTGISTLLLGGIYVALVAGDIVAKESEDGSLRLVLSRPVTRLRVLALKFSAAIIYNVLFVLFIGTSAYLLGSCIRGFGGGFFAMDHERGIFALHGSSTALQVYFTGICGLALSMITVTALAFFFSCMKLKPATATILALSCLFVDMVIFRMPFFPDIKDYLLTSNLGVWTLLCDYRILWPDVIHAYAYLFGINASLFIFGWLIFQSRDFKM